MQGPSFEDTAQGYTNLWAKCVVSPSRLTRADSLARVILDHASTYKAIEERTHVPWFMVGLIHMRESDFNFGTHLHNGDSLLGYTHHVPAGRPQVGHGPPFTFIESAADALISHGLKNIQQWPVSRILYELERYNGWGYTFHRINSPYVWAWTNLQQPGKYVEDGVWSSTAYDVQPGCAAILKRLVVLDATIAQRLGSPAQVPDPQDHSPEPPPTLGPDLTLDQRIRSFRYEGVLSIAGQTFEFATGGLNRGSAPFGTWEITPDAIGPIGQRLGAIGIAHGTVVDPKFPGNPRVGIEIHPGAAKDVQHLVSEGCIVLLPSKYPVFKKLLLDEIANKGTHLIRIKPDSNIEIIPVTQPVITHKEPPMSTVQLPNLDLLSIEQTIEHFEFVVPFLKMVFPQALLVTKAVEALLKAAAAVQAAPASDEATVAAAVIPALEKLLADLQALAPKVS